MGVHHWPDCNGNHPLGTPCNGGYSERVKADLDRQLDELRAQEYTAWETELRNFAHIVAPWAAEWDRLASWEKIWLSNMYLGTGRFWNERLGLYARKQYMSRPDGWIDSLAKDDQSGD